MILTKKSLNLITLLIAVPLTSIGATISLWIAPGIVGKIVLIFCQIILFSRPIVWLVKIENKPIIISQPKNLDWLTGILIGIVMFTIILLVYWLLLKDWIDVTNVQRNLTKIGNIDRQSFIFEGIYFSLINALIEEYVWRWFIYSRWEALIPGKIAVWLSALFFTLHHTIGLAAFVGWRVVTAGSIAVFVAGVIWSEYYRRYRSIWSNYFSHAIADIALYLVAWNIFFS